MLGAALDESYGWSGVRSKSMLEAALHKMLCLERH